jgi:hypothetical protein
MVIQEDAWKQPQFAYPFDQWAGSIIFAATDLLAAQAVGLPNSNVVILWDAVLADSTCEFSVHSLCNIGLNLPVVNWRMTINSNNTCLAPDVFAGCELVGSLD